ncbi:MAG: type II toxin-antitoxin system RelE/ParE family toxin [Kiritimatiellae bacterium]|nr:type II toxin-antitoxin system RelE/ParE family toxin [Kiritimatiellia bacterium]
MKVDFLQTADSEFAEAIAYYNLQSEGLGLEFAAEVKRGLRRILQYPAAWTTLSRRTRRCRLNRFPYALLYPVRQDLILIVAVQNLHKHPDSWKSRLRPDEA